MAGAGCAGRAVVEGPVTNHHWTSRTGMINPLAFGWQDQQGSMASDIAKVEKVRSVGCA
jgi:hypothetical protein